MRLRVMGLLILAIPASVQAQILAEAGPLAFGALDPTQSPNRGLLQSFDLPFYLTTNASVQVQVTGVRGTNRGPNAAPEVFLDSDYLGPVLPEQGQAWRGPRAIEMAPGGHKVTLRMAQSLDAENFVLKRIFVYAGSPFNKSDAPKKAITELNQLKTENGCGAKQRRDWFEAKKSGVTLSVLSGQVVGTGPLVNLQDGETWACGIKISTPYSKPLALMAGFQKVEASLGRWILSLDPEPPPLVKELGYKPARWERFQVQLCQGVLTIRFGKAPPQKIAWSQKEIILEIAAQSVEVALRPIL